MGVSALLAAAPAPPACLQVAMTGGVGYGIVVDGVGVASGDFKLRVTAAEGAVQGQLPALVMLHPANASAAGEPRTPQQEQQQEQPCPRRPPHSAPLALTWCAPPPPASPARS